MIMIEIDQNMFKDMADIMQSESSAQIDDNGDGNGNGKLEAGETGLLTLNLENRGSGIASDIIVDMS